MTHDVLIVGAGAAGLVAGISAARLGARCVLLDRLPSAGRKLLATGAGRCNLAHTDPAPERYNAEARLLIQSVLGRFGWPQIEALFGELGLDLVREQQRVFPATRQAVSVLKVLQLELDRLHVDFMTDTRVSSLTPGGDRWTVSAEDGRTWQAHSVLVCTGGRTYPSLGSDGSGYTLVTALGHTVIPPVPVCVPLTAHHPWIHPLQGLRLFASVTPVVSGQPGTSTTGDLLFTKYGLSGTAILDVSESLSLAYHRARIRDLAVSVDLLPHWSRPRLQRELERRRGRGIPDKDIWSGLLPERLAPLIAGCEGDPIDQVKRLVIRVTGTRGWNEAEFTAGGVSHTEVHTDTLMSTLHKGLFIAGELLNVHGQRGGFNLAWAWASGWTAGQSAADYVRRR